MGRVPYSANSIANLRQKEEVEVRRQIDLDLSIELEKRRRIQVEAEQSQNKVAIQPHHQAIVAAFPLRQFIYETFSILEPGREYRDNWHIDAISEMLEAATIGEIKKILINLPRRCMKSTLISVMWFTWAWTFLPYTRWLYASFSEKFAYRDSNLCRKLIDSAYFQQRWGEVFKKSLTEWKTARFSNNKGGTRACFGVTKGTGDGGDFVIVDDPHQIDEAESEKRIETTINWYFETYYNNVTDPKTAVRAIMHQRVSEQDLTGAILARELNYELLCLPMKFEDDHPHKNSISKPLKLGKVTPFEKEAYPTVPTGTPKLWIDPRDTKAPAFENPWFQEWYRKHYESRDLHSAGEGEILWPNRFDQHDIDEMVAHLQAYGESSQLQQRPVRRGGNFFHSPDFKPTIDIQTIDFTGMSFCRYWDKGGTENGGDPTVGMLMGRTPKRPFILYILDIFREQLGYKNRMEAMKRLAHEDTANYVTAQTDTEYTVAIERELASSGKDMASIEKEELLGFDVLIDIPKGKKGYRAKPAKNFSEQGRIKVVTAPWNLAFFRELEKFKPDLEHQRDDQIDTMSGGVKILVFGASRQLQSASGAI
jgi:predicted phage terminase large subunit-like protein